MNIHDSPIPVSPMPLFTAFGWSNMDINQPQDILEFWRVFTDALSKQGFSEILDKMFLSKHLDVTHRQEEARGKSSSKFFNHNLTRD
jgi:hypothetical protein